jgi:hypothetical protein
MGKPGLRPLVLLLSPGEPRPGEGFLGHVKGLSIPEHEEYRSSDFVEVRTIEGLEVCPAAILSLGLPLPRHGPPSRRTMPNDRLLQT